MFNIFKKKIKPFSSSEALKKSEESLRLKEAKELKDYKDNLFVLIDEACDRGVTTVYLGGPATLINNEKEIDDLLKKYGYLLEKDVRSNAYVSLTSSFFTTYSGGLTTASTPPVATSNTYTYSIKWGDKKHIFNQELAEIINEGDETEEDN